MREESCKYIIPEKDWPRKEDYEEKCPPEPTKNEKADIEQALRKRFKILYRKVLEEEGSDAKIYKKISEQYPYVPKSTFDNTVSESRNNLNEMVVIAFCQTFGYNIYDIFPPKSVAENLNTVHPRNYENNTIDMELPEGFYGRFYGYFFNSTPEYLKRGIIDQFTLDITREHISLILKHYALNAELNNIYSPREITLEGKILHNQGGASSSGILTLSFTSTDDDCFCTMAYNKFQLNGKLFFRRGALLLQSRGGEIMPTIQSFIFTDQKIDLNIEDNKRIVQGALRLTNKTILVKKNDLESFMDSELLKKYFEIVSYDNACKEYIELNEELLRGIDMDNNELYQTLFQIKSKDANAKLYTFPNIDRSWHYIASLCDREDTSQQEQ